MAKRQRKNNNKKIEQSNKIKKKWEQQDCDEKS